MVQVLIIIGIFAIVVALVLVIEFPQVLDTIPTYLDALIYYLGQAMDIVWIFVPRTFTVALMTLTISVEVIYLGYLFVMWVIRKIPTGGIR